MVIVIGVVVIIHVIDSVIVIVGLMISCFRYMMAVVPI